MHADRLAAIVAFAFGATMSVAAIAQDDEHFFEPGTRHVCVPAADGRGWNCDGAGDTKSAPAAADGPALRTSRASDLNASDVGSSEAIALDEAPAPVTTPVAPTAIAQATPPPAPPSAPAESARPSSRSVPNYLLSPDSRDTGAAPASTSAEVAPPPATPAPAEPVAETPTETTAPPETPVDAPVAAQPPPEPEVPAPTPEVTPAPVVAESPTPAPETPTPVAATPEPSPASEPAAPVETAAPTPPPTGGTSIASMRGSAEFLQLDGNRFVLELARGTDRTAVANAAGAIALAGGEIYLLRTPRDGSDWHIAAWGEFDSIDEARSARADAIANGADIPGWPRKIGPLQQEVRRADR